MDNRFNTIAGWVLFAGIVALGGSILTHEYFHAEHPEKGGYPIEGVTGVETDGAAAAEQPIAAYMAAADPKAGEAVFKRCMTCHTINKGGAAGNGPNLWGVVGGPVGHQAGFPYTADLKKLGGSWDWDKLNHWLMNPRGLVPGTKMSFAGLGKPEDRANILAYLNSQSDSPIPLPPPPAAAANPAAAGAEASGAGAPGKAGDQPVMNEAQAAKGGAANVGGEGAPSVAGNSQQTKTGK
jgi:cytochrome c